MSFAIDIAWIVTVMLVALRVGAALILTPILATGSVPANVRVLFVLGMALVLTAGLSVATFARPITMGELTGAAVNELIIGGLFAFSLFAAFATFQLAGRIADLQMGFGVATMIDPATRTHAPLLGTFLNLLAVALFFSVDGHHLLLRGLAFSLEHSPPGAALTSLDFTALVAQFGVMFSYALALIAPVLFTLLLMDVVIAVVARTMPQVNVFIVSLPLKIFVGLVVLALSINYLSPTIQRVFETVFDFLHKVFD